MSFNWEIFEDVPIVGIARSIDQSTLERIVPIYIEAGLTTLEVTMDSPNALELIAYLNKEYGDQLNIGAGTVRNRDDLELALRAKANFIVTPILDEFVVKECVRLRIPVFPGAYTPTEIYRAWSLGASIVKVFPATSLGSTYFKDLKGPFPEIKLMPTGGIGLDTISDYRRSCKVAGFGIGSPLFPKELIELGNEANMLDHFRKFVQAVKK